jgi:hypothetical protein
MKCQEAKNKHIWISCQGEYMRCIRTKFVNLQYEHFGGRWDEPGMLWGYPHQIEFDGNKTYNRMFVVEKIFKNKQEALEDMEKSSEILISIIKQFSKNIFLQRCC